MAPPFAFPPSLIEERFVRSSGPGGQNVNKVATAVELRFDVERSGLPEDVKARLRAAAGTRLTDGGILIIDAREFRSQSKNREAARARLEALLRQASKRPARRRKTKPSASAREQRLSSKRLRSRIKRGRGTSGSDD